VSGVRRSDHRMPFNQARSVSSAVSDSPEIVGGGGREVGDVFANETSPLRLPRLRDAVQEYVSQRRAMPEVREGVGEGKEPAESAAEISAVDGGTASRLIANREIAFVVKNSGIVRRQQ
jgi:hypothetical protein